MFELDDISYHYATSCGHVPALSGISLHIARGEYVAVLGANGSGKSTLALLLGGLILPRSGRFVVDGHVIESRKDLTHVRGFSALVHQDPQNAIVGGTVERDTAFGLECATVDSESMRDRVSKTLTEFDLSTLADREPETLSGGQLSRLALAGVAVLSRPVLVLDEPTSLLDPTGSAAVLDRLDSLHRSGTTVVHVTQYTKEAGRAGRVVVLQNGRVVADGAPREVIRDRTSVSYPSLQNIKTDERSSIARGDVLLCAENVSVIHDRGTPNETTAVEDVSLSFHAGEVVALIGPTGCGKTSLVCALSGLVVPVSGDVCVRDKPVEPGNISVAFQFPERAFSEETVGREVALSLQRHRLSPERKQQLVETALALVGFDSDIADRETHALSGGQARRVGLACALVDEPELIFLDEPDAALDPEGVGTVAQIIRDVRDNGSAVVVVTHDLDFAWSVADRMVAMANGRVVADVSAADRKRALEALDLPVDLWPSVEVDQ
jgi:energy-coupling factor transporter ATP-binding protein EcfA2